MDALSKVDKSFGEARKKAEQFAAATKDISASANSAGQAAAKAAPKMNKFASSIARIAKYRAIRAVIRAIVNAIKEGWENFAEFSKRTGEKQLDFANKLKAVQSAGNTMKSQLGAAFATLFANVQPILLKLIELATNLANVLTMLFARLGGASGWYKATNGANAAANAIDNAGNAAKKALKYLAPFDELNVLPSNDSGGGGGGGSGGGGGADYEWIEFDKIDIGDGIASVMDTIKNFFTNAASWIEGVDWQNLASNIVSGIATALGKVDWAGITKAVSEFLGAALGAVAGFLTGAMASLVESIDTDIYNLFHNDDGTKKTGQEIVNGIWEGIKTAISSAGTWIKDNIFTPFINGFKAAFGIASPAKEMEGPGEMVAEGILAGILKPFTAIGTWLNEHIVQPIKDYFGKTDFTMPFSLNIPEGFTEKLKAIKDAWDSITSKKPKLEPKLKGWKDATQKKLDKLKAAWGKIVDQDGTLTAKLNNKADLDVLDALKAAWSKVTDVTAMFTAELSAKQGVKDFVAAWNKLGNKALEIKASLADNIKNAWNKVANAWNGNSILSALGKLPVIAANGGVFNSGQLIIARESGPEIVGQFGSKTGVMNNQQIVAAVSNGVARAVAGLTFSVSSAPQSTYVNNEANEETLYRAMLRALNAADREPVEVNLDGQTIYRSVVRRNRMNTAATGVNALA